MAAVIFLQFIFFCTYNYRIIFLHLSIDININYTLNGEKIKRTCIFKAHQKLTEEFHSLQY